VAASMAEEHADCYITGNVNRRTLWIFRHVLGGVRPCRTVRTAMQNISGACKKDRGNPVSTSMDDDYLIMAKNFDAVIAERYSG
jgi:hypothetical protein